MIRVTRLQTSEGRPRLRLEDRLIQPTVEEFEMECRTMMGRVPDLQIDVTDLQFADATGVEVLRTLETEVARLEGRSPLVDALLAGNLGDADQHPASPPAPVGDIPLVARLKARDGGAFEDLVRLHGGRLLATARRLLPNEEDTRDVVQDALLSAFRSIDGFEGSARLTTWLHRIVVNVALMKIRSRKRRREESIEALLPRFAEDGHFAEPVASWQGGAETLLAGHESRAMVRRAIDLLPDSYRTILVMRDIEELDTEETAGLLGIRTNAVKTRLHRARQALRTLLEREITEESAPPGLNQRLPSRTA